jgi:hypothetical protein
MNNLNWNTLHDFMKEENKLVKASYDLNKEKNADKQKEIKEEVIRMTAKVNIMRSDLEYRNETMG